MVLAALVSALVGALVTITSAYLNDVRAGADLRARYDAARCARAFDYLQDESINAALPANEQRAFALEQLRAARECQRRTIV